MAEHVYGEGAGVFPQTTTSSTNGFTRKVRNELQYRDAGAGLAFAKFLEMQEVAVTPSTADNNTTTPVKDQAKFGEERPSTGGTDRFNHWFGHELLWRKELLPQAQNSYIVVRYFPV